MGGASSALDKLPSYCTQGGGPSMGDGMCNSHTLDLAGGSNHHNHSVSPFHRARSSGHHSNTCPHSSNCSTGCRSNNGCGGMAGVSAALHQLPGRGMSKLHTLRKKMCKLRRRSNYTDYGKQFRDFASTWSCRELHCLRQEYEALSALKELTVQAIVARPSPSNLKTDMGVLFEYGWCTDVQITYRGALYDVHKAILSARCPFFRSRFSNWLAKPDVTNNNPGGIGSCRDNCPSPPMPIELDSSSIDVPVFTCLIKYLYTGSICMEEARLENWDTLSLLCEKFGMPNPLDQDMASLLNSSSDADCVLVFSHTPSSVHSMASRPSPSCEHRSSTSGQSHPDLSHHLCHHHQSSLITHQPPCELYCHRAVLASRSKFFRNVILRRTLAACGDDTGDPLCGASGHPLAPISSNIRIVLDESIIPRRFARVLLHCLYTDQLDLSLLGRVEGSCLYGGLLGFESDTQPHNHEGRCGVGVAACPACLQDVMELYQIGQFLEFPMLCHACENILVSSLSIPSLVPILRWSGEAYGSLYVHRQAAHFLREEFLPVAHSAVLLDLNKQELGKAIASNLLQARESDVLSAVIRWGENQLIRKMEEREPSQIPHSHSAHGVSKKGIKKKDLSDVELGQLVSDLMPLVRLEQVLPSCADQVHSAIRRGLIPHPPTLYMLHSSSQTEVRTQFWCRSPSNRPRLVGGVACVPQTSPEPPPRSCGRDRHSNSGFVPPRLFTPFYEEIKSLLMEQYKVCKSWLDPPGVFSSRPPARQPLDLLPTSALPHGHAIAVLDHHLVKAVRKRARELEQMLLVQRALLMPCVDRGGVFSQLQLCALREAGLPDSALSTVFSGLSTLSSSGKDEGEGQSHHCPAHYPAPPMTPPPAPISANKTDVKRVSSVLSTVGLSSGLYTASTTDPVWRCGRGDTPSAASLFYTVAPCLSPNEGRTSSSNLNSRSSTESRAIETDIEPNRISRHLQDYLPPDVTVGGGLSSGVLTRSHYQAWSGHEMSNSHRYLLSSRSSPDTEYEEDSLFV